MRVAALVAAGLQACLVVALAAQDTQYKIRPLPPGGPAPRLTDGHVDQTNFHQYTVLRINEMPRQIEIHIVPSADPPTGVGEPGLPPIAPAVANAVRMATGLTLRKLPFDLADAKA